MAHKAPGKAHRDGITLLQLAAIFPDEQTARDWFEGILWPAGIRNCPRCDSTNTHECSHVKMPYRCRDCRKYFSVKTGTVMAGSPLPLRKWVYAIYLDTTSLKGVSSMKLHRDLGITQKSAWFMQQRIREAFAHKGPGMFDGPVEADETFVGGRRHNMPLSKRKEMEGRGPVDMTAVAGIKDRETNQVTAKVIEHTDAKTLQGFIRESVSRGATVYTDDAPVYDGMRGFAHESVNHSGLQYVRGMAHTNGIESFWSMLKRAHKGTFHKISPKHLNRYVQEFAGRHNIRDFDTLSQMILVAAGLVGRFLPYRQLTADNGLASGARS